MYTFVPGVHGPLSVSYGARLQQVWKETQRQPDADIQLPLAVAQDAPVAAEEHMCLCIHSVKMPWKGTL